MVRRPRSPRTRRSAKAQSARLEHVDRLRSRRHVEHPILTGDIDPDLAAVESIAPREALRTAGVECRS